MSGGIIMKNQCFFLVAFVAGILVFSCPMEGGNNNEEKKEPPKEPVYYTVRYYHNLKLDEEAAVSFSIKEGEKIEPQYRAATPTRSGYQFKGWYQADKIERGYPHYDLAFDIDKSTSFDFTNIAVTNDLHLYALWTNAVTVGANNEYYTIKKIFETVFQDVELGESYHHKYFNKKFVNEAGDSLQFNLSYVNNYDADIASYSVQYDIKTKEPVRFTFLTYDLTLPAGKDVDFECYVFKPSSTPFSDTSVLKYNDSVEIDFYANDPQSDPHLPLFDDGLSIYDSIDSDDLMAFQQYLQQDHAQFTKIHFKTYGIDRIEMADYGSAVTGTFYFDKAWSSI
jgi:uncharacterized repeat protein (TIGR02543 family)